MPAAESTNPTAIADIQRQMAQIRSDMHQEVQGAVRTAQALTDWHAAVRNHPWLSLTGAAIAGYLIVPKRQPQAPTIVAMGSPSALMAAAPEARSSDSKNTPWKFVGTALSLLA